MMHVGVTGGSGFIGQYVVKELQAQGMTPVVFDRSGHVGKGDDIFLGDVNDPESVTEFAAHVDGIIHLAAVLGTAETINNPRPGVLTNVIGSLNVFEAAVQYDLPVCYIGVGNHFMAASTYTISKTCAEQFARNMFNPYRGAKINVVRAMNAYGAGQLAAAPFGPGKVRKITPAFVCRALSGMPIEIYGSGKQISDMVYVGDVAKTLVAGLKAATSGTILDRVVEAGPKEHLTVTEVAKLVGRACVERGYDPVPINYIPMRPGETEDAVVSADWETLGLVGLSVDDFKPLSEGIAETVDWFIKNEGITWSALESWESDVS